MYFYVILGKSSIICVLCKAAVYIYASELLKNDKSISICKKFENCTDKNHKNVEK